MVKGKCIYLTVFLTAENGAQSRYQCLNISHLKQVFSLSIKRNESPSSGISYLVSPSTESELQHRA